VKSVEVKYEGQRLGIISVLHPQIRQKLDKKMNVAFLELNMTLLHTLKQRQVKFTEPPKFPEVMLDFSFLADKSAYFDKIKSDIEDYKNSLLVEYGFMDLYSGKGLPEGKKSMMFRFIIGSRERTLSSEEINQFTEGLLKHMENRGYSLR
jgi:phenylalanyl-tRNA synthetase beta chain